jgi:MOSC domain-containing protein YiiM
MPTLTSIVYSPKTDTPEPPDHYQRVPVAQAVLGVKGGLQGDRKGRQPDRQLNVMTAEVLAGLAAEGFQTGPGQMGEQLVISGLDVNQLAGGDRLQIGAAAVIEVVKPRTGCARFEAIQGLSRQQAAGRMGQMCRVVADGPIAVGDAVRLVVAEPSGTPV